MPFTFTLFDAPGAGTGTGQGTYPLQINNTGGCSGIYFDSSFNSHGFIRDSGGTVTTFDPVGATQTHVAGINDSNTVCGWFEGAGGFHDSQGFIRASDGTITTFVYPGAVEINMGLPYLEEAGFSIQLWSVGNCINNNGDVVGVWRDSGGTWHGFIRAAAGTFTSFDLAGDYASGIAVSGINNSGDVCGNYLTHPASVSYYKSFFRTASGTITEYASPSAGTNGNNGTLGYSINDTQDIGGYYVDNSGLLHGFVRNSDGTFVEYDVPGTTHSTLSTCINSTKQTTGWYGNNAPPPFWTHGFVRNSDGSFVTFDPENMPSNAILAYPYGINNSGCVAGSVTNDDLDDIVHGFIGCSSSPDCFKVDWPLTTYFKPDGTPLANGYILVKLVFDCECPCANYQITGSNWVKVNLDSNGVIIGTHQVRPNPQLKPDGSYYIVNAYTQEGQLVLGPKKVVISGT